jgi:aspartyl protease family protein
MNFNDLNNSDWQNFIYLFLLLVFFAASIFSRRDLPFAKILKYLAIWSGIALVAIIFYSYRYEFSDFKNRVLGEINPSLVRVEKSGELVISLSQDGHFYMDVRVNGKPMRFMIDTGASDIVIGVSDAKKLGINVENLVFNKLYQTANGTSRGASVLLKEIIVGNQKFANVWASVNSAEMGTPLLGMSFLRQFSKYEFYRDKLILTF